jgi:hypothetical protein
MKLLFSSELSSGNKKPLAVAGLICAILLSACRFAATADNSTPIRSLVTEELSSLANDSLLAVTSAIPPARDMVDVTARFRGIYVARTVRKEPLQRLVGDVEAFWIKDLAANRTQQIEATLAYRSDHLNMWVQMGENVKLTVMADAASFIEQQILPTNRALFGSEWQPGIDGDPRINVLHLRDISGIGAAYFWSGDEYVTAVNPFSNQRELIYISLKKGPVGSDAYFSAFAHEHQHLIRWHVKANEDAWLNEGLAELATHVNGFPTRRDGIYAANTDTQLNTLSHDPDAISAHYAAATLFTIYMHERFGNELIRGLARAPDSGLPGIAHALSEMGSNESVKDLFTDWLVANYLEGEQRGEGVHQYRNLELRSVSTEDAGRLPYKGSATVSQYGADYIRLSGDEPVTFVFTGTQQVQLIEATPHSGRMYFVSSPGDESDMSLTRVFDLTRLETATLSFWTWYDIEEGWDYGYVAVSGDGGLTWSLLETEDTTIDNPEGNSLGPGFTGTSGGGEQPVWTQQIADLSKFAGGTAHIRFQYLTDGAVHGQGFVLDDIAIPELGYLEDVEEDDDSWRALGFARTGQMLPQEFIIQQIVLSDRRQQVSPLELDENQRGRWQIPMDNENSEAILVVSGITPVTRAVAAYDFEFYQ